ncbi:MAG TPA: OmpA family protein [Bryobacteraceae bacterium]|nr:OmpA family protein [Bryobacteraceae bacterium]
MKLISSVVLTLLPAVMLAQEPNPTQSIAQQSSTAADTTNNGSTPIFRVEVVSRSIAAVSYRDRSGWTKVDFQGTTIAPQAKGNAQVRGQLGHVEVKLDVKDLPAPTSFGPLYLTYVVWAITPDGHPANLGEVVVDSHGNYSGVVTTDLQAFGLIITAEPYFDVHQPSDVVAMENIIRKDTEGKWETVNAKYELLPRGNYTYHVPEQRLKPVDLNSSKKSPLELYEAQNAVQIAQYARADKYASDVYQSAEKLWQQAQDYETRKQWKPAVMIARETVAKAEDARTIALRREQQEALDTERREAAERQSAAQQKAAEAARQAELAQQQAQASQEQSQRDAAQRAAAEQAKAEADAARAQADAARTQAAAEALRAQQSAEEANRLRAQAEQQKEQLRQQLLQQFNAVLPTHESSRGLVINMQDVLFAIGKYDLTSPAQVALARISGIVISHPGLNLHVEGYTDSTGTMQINQKLSDHRAEAVRDFLINQGLDPAILTAQGYGESYPVASNDTAAGRKQNRRVELVISGEVIGVRIGVPPAQDSTSTGPMPVGQPPPQR